MADSSTSPVLRIGTVPFLNAAPLTFGLDADPLVRLVRLAPAPLSAALARGELDAALVPSAAFLGTKGLSLLEGAAVSSDGPVRSVRLFLRVPVERVRRVALDRGSVTSAALVRILLRRAYDLRPEYAPAPASLESLRDADAALVIGDAALVAEREAARRGIGSLDLGSLWRESAGLPFVYALFAVAPGAPRSVFPVLERARERGLRSIPAIAQAAAGPLSIDAGSLESYLTRNIRYSLGERELKGLHHFRDALVEEGLLPAALPIATVG